MSKRSSQYRSVHWQKKRLEILERDNWTCRSCQKGQDDLPEGVMLNVHHIYYTAGKKPWEYHNALLITWCDECHQKRHDTQNMICLALSDFPLDALSGFKSFMDCTRSPYEFFTTIHKEKCPVDESILTTLLKAVYSAFNDGVETGVAIAPYLETTSKEGES